MTKAWVLLMGAVVMAIGMFLPFENEYFLSTTPFPVSLFDLTWGGYYNFGVFPNSVVALLLFLVTCILLLWGLGAVIVKASPQGPQPKPNPMTARHIMQHLVAGGGAVGGIGTSLIQFLHGGPPPLHCLKPFGCFYGASATPAVGFYMMAAGFLVALVGLYS